MPDEIENAPARHGYHSEMQAFAYDDVNKIVQELSQFVREPSPEQVRAWKDSLPPIQQEAHEIVEFEGSAKAYTAVLEYEMPMEQRRADVIFLLNGAVVVLELKGAFNPSMAAIDQASAYARDLRNYHDICADLPVYAVVVPTAAKGIRGKFQDVYVCGPDAIDELIQTFDRDRNRSVDPKAFLSAEAYRPLPTLVRAARELFETGTLRRVRIASAQTDPAINLIASLIRNAKTSGKRKLILLAGIPGAGKTLVGLQTVHSSFIDDLSVPRADGRKPTAPAVFLSGNGPLVEVLQYELRGAGDGKTFVRGVKDYVKKYSSGRMVPPEHVLVFDEAQRAWDASMVEQKHPGMAAKSEPEHFIEFAERIPDWSVVVALIGSGQEIHTGEEGGTIQWRHAIERSTNSGEWEIHGPSHLSVTMASESSPYFEHSELHLDTELRFHMAKEVHRFVDNVLEGEDPDYNKQISSRFSDQYALRITRDLNVAKSYMVERFANESDARFGILASSRDKCLPMFGVFNDFQATKQIKIGKWFGDDENAEGGYGGRNLRQCVTEFQCQGLELDGAIVAWGTDFVYEQSSVDGSHQWTNHRARKYMKSKGDVRNPLQLRKNAYRVLLTRGRNATVIFVPPLRELDSTYTFLIDSGFVELT